ncbi:MAG: hypothetical protein IT160_11750 [Bryobacterales bacterium]|nr:hypothetical protein [Bryobacterales bacterium]
MERHAIPETAIGRQVPLTVLGGREVSLAAKLEKVWGRGARLRSCCPVPLGAAVRFDLDDALLLGEVCYCAPDGDSFIIGIVVDQALTSVGSVLALIRSVMGEREHSAEGERSEAMNQRREQRQYQD